MNEIELVKLFKCLADRSRLQILKALALEDMYAERLAQRIGVTAPTITFHMKKLLEVNVVYAYKNQYYTMYSLRKEVFEMNLLEILMKVSQDQEDQVQRDQAYREKVLASFFEYQKLKTIPTQQKKRQIVLEEVVKLFEVNQVYQEREINLILADIYDDFVVLRQELIGAALLKRQNQEYHRVK